MDALASVPRIKWSSHRNYLRENFAPGEHVLIVVPTGGGKSYLIVEGLTKLPALRHSRVLMIDDKHNDPSTKHFGMPVTKWPGEYYPRQHTKVGRIANGKKECPDPEHYRLLVPGWNWAGRSVNENARKVVLEALQQCYKTAEEGDGWVVILDETRSFTDLKPPSLDLAPALKYMLRMGRYRHLTVIAATQMPMGIPGEFFDQPTHFYFGYDSDDRRIERFAELGGSLPRKLMRETIPTLDNREFLYLGNRGRHAAVIMVGRE